MRLVAWWLLLTALLVTPASEPSLELAGIAHVALRVADLLDISNVCEGTDKKNDLNYYLQRKRNVGDLHGQAPLLWSAWTFLR